MLIVPAMAIPAKKYDVLAEHLASKGVSSVICELRGVATSSLRASRAVDFGYETMIDYDLNTAIKNTQLIFPANRIIFFGHSLGGQLLSLYLAKHKPSVDHLILSASCSIYYRGWRFPKNLFILFFTQVSRLISVFVGYFPGKKMKFGGREARTVIQDWARVARTGNYKLTSSDVDYEEALRTVDAKILAINFKDDGFAPQRATENLLNKFENIKITRNTLTKEQLNASSADHFSWLRHPEAVATSVSNWLRRT